MKKLLYLAEILILLLIFHSLIIKKNYLIGIPFLLFYIAYRLFKCKASILAFKGNKEFTKHNFQKSLAYYESALNAFNCGNHIKLRYAYIALYCGEIKRCKDILDIIPTNQLPKELYNSYKITEALYIWKCGDLRKAIDICKDVHNDFNHTLVYETLGYLLIISKRYNEALEYNKKAYEYDSNSLIILDNLAESYYYIGDFEKSKELYENLINKKEDTISFPEPYYYYGIILNKLGNKSSAKKYIEKSLTKKEYFLSNLTHKKIKQTLSTL